MDAHRRQQQTQEAAGVSLKPVSTGNGGSLQSGSSSRRTSEASSSQASTPCPSTPTTWSSGSGSESDSGVAEEEPLASSAAPDDHTPATARSIVSNASTSSSTRRLISEEDDAVFAAIHRISRFMDFRERCASEVLSKLGEVGYDPQFAHTVLKRMQEAVSRRGEGWGRGDDSSGWQGGVALAHGV